MRPWFIPLLAVFVCALRLPYFNNPAVGIDEQFYFVVAEKWLHHGMLPYVDIWDRKPIGIFVIYAAALLIVKNGVLGYKILAAIFVVATGAVLARIGGLLRNEKAGILAAFIYVVAVMLMDGPDGQTAVFYNLPVATAALLYVRVAVPTESKIAHPAAAALAASLLLGLAIQINYICALEATTLSLFALAAMRYRLRTPWFSLMGLALGMVLCGLLPTVIVGGIYAHLGHWPEFYASNFESILAKHLWSLHVRVYAQRLATSLVYCVAFIPLAAYELTQGWRKSMPADDVWVKATLAVWLCAAFLGALMLGNPTQHYFLPTLTALSVLTGAGLQRLDTQQGLWKRAGGYGGLIALLVAPVLASFIVADRNARVRGEPADVWTIAAFMKEHLGPGCPYIFNQFPILYSLTDACTPSLYAFPNHLAEIAEVRTPDRERLKELARVLAAQPPLIFVRRPHSSDFDAEAVDLLEQTLRDNYTVVFHTKTYRQDYSVYAPNTFVSTDRADADQIGN